MGVFSTPIAAGLAKVALVVVSVGGLTAGAVFAYQTTQGGDGGAAGQVEPTGSPTALATSTQPASSPTATEPPLATPTSTPQPPTQQPLPTEAPPAPTPDTRVPIRDLPTAEQIQLTKDGTYFIADRGDGCTWVEVFRGTITFQAQEILQVTLDTDCPVDFTYAFWPDKGEVNMQVE